MVEPIDHSIIFCFYVMLTKQSYSNVEHAIVDSLLDEVNMDV